MDGLEHIDEQGVSIVAHGTFNPAIFHPSWLARHSLITDEEEKSAKLEITHPEVSQFQIPGVRFDIQTERALIQAAVEPLVRSADLFGIIFGTLLPHTPIESVGINYWAHYRTKDWAQRQRYGRLLAPIEPWGEFGAMMETKDKESAGGFSTLSFKASFSQYGTAGFISITIQPSVKVDSDLGVFINVNHHFSNPDKQFVFSDVVQSCFDDVVRRSREFISHSIICARAF